MEDKKISDISKLLIGGAKMLSYHCPECKIPLFQEGDRVFCPSCQKEVIIEGKKESERLSIETEDKKTRSISNQKESRDDTEYSDLKKREMPPQVHPGVVNEIEQHLRETILRLSRELKYARNLSEIKEIIETIERTSNLLERIRSG
jgi:UPF0148 protein